MRLLSLDEVRSLQLALLKEFDIFCKKENLTYYLAFGTLLGAVRHKGYIPWDNDMDISMPRTDYNRLVEMFSKDGDAVNPYFGFYCYENNKEYMWEDGRIYVKGTWMKTANENFKLGLSIDVFPLGNQGNTYAQAIRHSMKINHYGKLKCMAYDLKYKKLSYPTNCSVLERIKIFIEFNWMKDGKKEAHWVEKNLKLAEIMELKGATAYYGCKPINYIAAEKREWYQGTVYLDFEGHKFPVPTGYKEILKAYYGDYMELPPLEERNKVSTMKIYADDAAWKICTRN